MWCSSPKSLFRILVTEKFFDRPDRVLLGGLAIISKPHFFVHPWVARRFHPQLRIPTTGWHYAFAAAGFCVRPGGKCHFRNWGKGFVGTLKPFFGCCIWVVRHLKIFIQSLVHIKRSITSFTLMSASLRVSSKSLRGTTFEWDSSSANHHVMKAEIVESEPWSKKVLLKNGRSSHLLHHLFGQHLIPSKVISYSPEI